jgi:hypothetical protein
MSPSEEGLRILGIAGYCECWAGCSIKQWALWEKAQYQNLWIAYEVWQTMVPSRPKYGKMVSV